MKHTFFFLLLFAIPSVWGQRPHSKNKHQEQTNTADSLHINETHQLGVFVQKIDLSELCYPHTLYITFSIDTTGLLTEPEFKPVNGDISGCTINLTYIESLKKDFEQEKIYWKQLYKDGKREKVKYSLPIRFD